MEQMKEALFLKSLNAPTNDMKFPSGYFISLFKYQQMTDEQKAIFKKDWNYFKRDLDMSFSTYKQKFEKHYLDFQNHLISLSLTDADVKSKKKIQIDNLKAEQEKYSSDWIRISKEIKQDYIKQHPDEDPAKVITRDLMLESVEQINFAIAQWDSFNTDWKNESIDDAISRLEALVIEAKTSSYKNLFQSYLERLQGKKTGILQAGNFDHKKIFDDLNLKEIIEGDFNSWNYYFTGAECSNHKPITWKWKKSELLYFLSKYCIDFGTAEQKNRKIFEANQIFVNVLKNNDEIAKSTTKTREIDKMLK
jgi:hypothetical protein